MSAVVASAEQSALVAAGVVGLVVFVLAWEALVRILDVRPFVLRAPSKIVPELFDEPRFFLDHTLTTARHALVGILIALACALVIGAVLATSRFLEHASQPVLTLILVTPWVAYINSVVLWLGTRHTADPVHGRVRVVSGVHVRHRRRAPIGGPVGARAARQRRGVAVRGAVAAAPARVRSRRCSPRPASTSASGSPPPTSPRAERSAPRVSDAVGRAGDQLQQRQPAVGGDPVHRGARGGRLTLVTLLERVLLGWHVSQR